MSCGGGGSSNGSGLGPVQYQKKGKEMKWKEKKKENCLFVCLFVGCVRVSKVNVQNKSN